MNDFFKKLMIIVAVCSIGGWGLLSFNQVALEHNENTHKAPNKTFE